MGLSVGSRIAMLKAAIAIDDWKLPIFTRHLSEAGYVFEQLPGVTDDSLLLMVNALSAKELEVVVRAANDEARKSRQQ